MLHDRWRALVPHGTWFGVGPLENALREHNRMYAGSGLEPLPFEAMVEDPRWVEFRRQAEGIMRLFAERGRST